jgi:DNA-binding transcriptional LysR family regulator
MTCALRGCNIAPMDMHHVRYFLAVARTLHFTRAAEACNVTQPSLTRAIKQLEDELGGDLFRRERPQAQLTELGQRMLPLLRQCYESAMGARSLARAMKSGETGALRLALSHTIDLKLLLPHLVELQKAFDGLELKVLRGSAAEIVELLKSGEAELGMAASPLRQAWERLDSWPLFSEGFCAVLPSEHRLANRSSIAPADLVDERIIVRSHCEQADELAESLRNLDIDISRHHEIRCEGDLVPLLEASVGIAFVSGSACAHQMLRGVPLNGIELKRTIYVYGVAGRERTAVASTLLKMLRASSWTEYAA